MKHRRNHNPKKRMAPVPVDNAAWKRLDGLARQARYGGNPEHKRNPGDFGLTPASSPRQGKTLCDVAGVFARSRAARLLKKGIRAGLVSEQHCNGWPRIVWAMAGDHVLEARLDNADQGSYHGYPLAPTDPFCGKVRERWSSQ